MPVPRVKLSAPGARPILGWDVDPQLPRTASFRCSNGHIGSLRDHDISTQGEVTPSVQCPRPKCGFHETVVLVGWPYRDRERT